MHALFLAELNERLFVHFTQGRWCAALGQRLVPTLTFDGARLARIACGDAEDVQRAFAGLDAGAPGDTSALRAAWQGVRGPAAALRGAEGFVDVVAGVEPTLPGHGPLVLLSAADAPLGDLAAVLIAGAARGVVWKPAPRAAASAHFLMQVLGPGAGGRLALVQGDHATGRLLVGRGALVWASGGAVPPEVGVPQLTLGARAPRRQ